MLKKNKRGITSKVLLGKHKRVQKKKNEIVFKEERQSLTVNQVVSG